MSTSAAATSACRHCGLPSPPHALFCCAGCESVYHLLAARGLTRFYELRDRTSFRKPLPVSAASPGFFADERGEEPPKMRFYLEGIHCLGCLWLLEKLPELDRRIRRSSLDLSHSILAVEIQPEGIRWTEVAELLAKLGYAARPLESDDGAAERRADQRKQLIRLGVAGFCAGNVMLLAVSIYAGADAWWSRSFAWLSLLLALPALTYSAWPIYQSAFRPLRYGRLSVDLAIALALVAGFGMSLWSLLSGQEREVFFDSLTMLVFLLLSSRLLLGRFQESLARESACLRFLSRETYLRLGPPAEHVAPGRLGTGDVLLLRAGQTLPSDSTLLSEAAHFDLSLLTGESEPAKILPGDAVDSGARLLSPEARVSCLRLPAESRLAKILEQADAYRASRAPVLDFADRMGRHFVLVVLSLAALTFALRPDAEGLRRALALVIVTCPCVLAFAVPLAMTRALQVAASRGILFRGADKLEALASARALFLDKTGTLTSGAFSVLRWEQLGGDGAEARAAFRALESLSSHPVAKAVVRHLKDAERTPPVSGFAVLPGSGVQGWIEGHEWRAARLEESSAPGGNAIGLFRDGALVARVVLGDQVRPEAREVVGELGRMGLSPSILSGDTEPNVAALARETGVAAWRSRLLPEEKAAAVSSAAGSVMVGDGANDAVAFQGASVGVAVQGAMEAGLRNAGVVLSRPGLGGLLEALRLARRTMRIVRENFAVTLAYNVVAGALAMGGRMSPLLAAVLMPSSALTVFALTQWRTRGGRV